MLWLLLLGAMPRLKGNRKANSGDNAKGAARINASADTPNTNSSEHRDKFMGKFTAAELVPRSFEKENTANADKVREVAERAHKKKSGGPGLTQGKSARTLANREVNEERLLEKEEMERMQYMRDFQAIEVVLAARDVWLKPEADRLGYDELDLYDKYLACRAYFRLRWLGANATVASEQAGEWIMVSGSTVRRWSLDYLSQHEAADGQVASTRAR